MTNKLVTTAASVILAALILIGFLQLVGMFRLHVQAQLEQATRWIAPFEIVNTYGLFAVMTTTRDEVVVEGSNDAQQWQEYNFKFKPGDTRGPLRWIAPYQPRLDWQMWFAALGTYNENQWCGAFFYRLLTNSKAVTDLLEPSTFPAPPKHLRAVLYEYTFTTPAERGATKEIWHRKLVGTWFGPVSLRPSQQ